MMPGGAGNYRRQGTGTVTYKGGKWHAYAPEARHPETGKRVKPFLGRHDFKHQAEAAITNWLREHGGGAVC